MLLPLILRECVLFNVCQGRKETPGITENSLNKSLVHEELLLPTIKLAAAIRFLLRLPENLLSRAIQRPFKVFKINHTVTSIKYSACNMSFETPFLITSFPTFNSISRKLHIDPKASEVTTPTTQIQHLAQKYSYNVWVGMSSLTQQIFVKS